MGSSVMGVPQSGRWKSRTAIVHHPGPESKLGPTRRSHRTAVLSPQSGVPSWLLQSIGSSMRPKLQTPASSSMRPKLQTPDSRLVESKLGPTRRSHRTAVLSPQSGVPSWLLQSIGSQQDARQHATEAPDSGLRTGPESKLGPTRWSHRTAVLSPQSRAVQLQTPDSRLVQNRSLDRPVGLIEQPY